MCIPFKVTGNIKTKQFGFRNYVDTLIFNSNWEDCVIAGLKETDAEFVTFWLIELETINLSFTN